LVDTGIQLNTFYRTGWENNAEGKLNILFGCYFFTDKSVQVF